MAWGVVVGADSESKKVPRGLGASALIAATVLALLLAIGTAIGSSSFPDESGSWGVWMLKHLLGFVLFTVWLWSGERVFPWLSTKVAKRATRTEQSANPVAIIGGIAAVMGAVALYQGFRDGQAWDAPLITALFAGMVVLGGLAWWSTRHSD